MLKNQWICQSKKTSRLLGKILTRVSIKTFVEAISILEKEGYTSISTNEITSRYNIIHIYVLAKSREGMVFATPTLEKQWINIIKDLL